MALGASSTARFELSLDQLHLLERHCPTVALPPEFHIEWESDVAIDERESRDQLAEQGLIEQGLVSPGESDIATRVSPALLGFLSMFADPALVLGVRSWNRERTFIQSIAVLSGFAVSLVRTQRVGERSVTPLNEDAAEVSAFELPEAVSELLRSLPIVDAPQANGAPNTWAVMPLTQAQALIEAIRGGRDQIVAAVAADSGQMDSVSIVGRAAGDIVAGFTFFATSMVTSEEVVLHWFRSEGGWFELSASTPIGGESVATFVEGGMVRIAATGTSSIVAAVTIAVAGLAGALGG